MDSASGRAAVGTFSSAPALSLVVCTRNRAPFLPQALRAFNGVKSTHAWEMVLVDNGSTDATPQLLTSFAQQTSIPTRVITEFQPGLSRARNAGWKAAMGRIIAFTDDDCYPEEDFVDSVLAAFEANPHLGFLGGRVLLFDPQDLPVTIQTLNQRRGLPARSYVPHGLIHGANFAMRKEVLAAIDGFDVRLGAGAGLAAGEDCDALVRASTAGSDGLYDPNVVVHHHHRRQKQSDLLSLERSYAIGRGAYFAKAVLDPASRWEYLRNWYWRLRENIRSSDFPEIRHEATGAASFLWRALREGRHLGS